MKTPTILWYFADPMCSWCWGFTPVLDKIKQTYGDELKIAMMLGGLRPGTTEPMTSALREEILHHWHEVQKLTGQGFSFDGALPDGFVYDTEPPSRAVITVSEINPELVLPYFKSVQQAFYLEQKDVTDLKVLTDLASNFSIEVKEFVERFNHDETKKKTQQHFQQTRQAEVTGFPSLVIQAGPDFKKIASGYQPIEKIKQEIDLWLQEHH